MACMLPLALALAGCGGGFYLGDNFDDNDDPPQVVLIVSPDIAEAGGEVRLRASASDDSGIDEVIFFRVDGAVSTRLGSDETAPYELDTELPDDATAPVQFFARAIDNDGQSRDSDLFSVTVNR
ncbi:Ig-like domain-containing protein [Methylibium sp.]|uniref:Ig-like domain-containing protein n=1 Tax=Methylibium sp. TaxID=2067992 RepID=UPI0017C9B477|nr:Ig-like domain-containing protein [Methylibium sp.]MBA3592121.1 Ig-like domain-containing protein [Methylibium sp.]